MSISYINTKGPMGIETIDELDSKDFKSILEFRRERRKLCEEYELVYRHEERTVVYISSRCTKEWRDR